MHVPQGNKAVAVLLVCVAGVCVNDCTMRRYSRAELQKQAAVTYPKEYEAIISPLAEQLVPIRKRIFFLKHEVEEMKNKLFEAGTNQRVARIDDRIDILRKEISTLSTVRKEILNTIYYIYPDYVEPEIVPFIGDNKSYKKFTGPILLITAEDQQEYTNARSNEETMSGSTSCKYLCATALKQFNALPDSLKPRVRPIGSSGSIRKIAPYTPPKQQ